MGAGASVGAEGEGEAVLPTKVTQLKQLPDAIEESIFVDERFPVIIDQTEQAGRFLKYQVRRQNYDEEEEEQGKKIRRRRRRSTRPREAIA